MEISPDDEKQRRLQQAARECIGAMAGSDAHRSETVQRAVRTRLRKRNARWRDLRLPLLTSEAVLTELFHIVGDRRLEVEAAWRFLHSAALVLATIENSELRQVHALMSRYWDRPMDFAHATLVYLAKRESLSNICGPCGLRHVSD